MSLTKQQASIRSLWLEAAGALVKADKALDKANTERKGGYTSAVQAAIVAETREVFDRETEAVFSDIRANADGIAVRLGCKPGKGRAGVAPGYLIPGSLSNAKSIIGKAFEYKVALAEKDDDGKMQPRKFRAIRDDVTTHDNAAKVAGLDQRGKNLHMVRELCQQISANAEAFTETETAKAIKALTALVNMASGAVERETAKAQQAKAAASKGADLAKTGEVRQTRAA